MSIEDVGYLIDNSDVDSTTFFVDSALRDRNVWPTPAEFCTSFEEPFRLVTGIEVLDAAIPSTMYVVDQYTDTLVTGVITNAGGSSMTIQSLMSIGQNIPAFQGYMGLSQSSDALVCTSVAWDGLSPALVQTATPFDLITQCTSGATSTDTIYIAMVLTVLSAVPMYSNVGNQYNKDSSYTCFTIVNQGNYAFLTSSATAGVVDAVNNGRIFIAPDQTFQMLDFYQIDSHTAQDIRDNLLYELEIHTNVLQLERQNYDINSLMLQLGSVLSSCNVSVSSTTSGTVDMASKYKFVGTNEFFLDMQRSTCNVILGFDQYAQPSDSNGSYTKIWCKGNDQLFLSQFDSDSGTYALVGPGVVDVSGVKYLLLRCQEIEDFMPRNARSSDPGIGMFKLADTNDVTHLRFDFVSLKRKPIHPIGKLTRMTFRFEMSNGVLYDFKGVNLQMLLMVKFLSPGVGTDAGKRFNGSILNPEYTPDYMKYMIMNMQRSLLEYKPTNQTHMNGERGTNEEEDTDDEEEYTDDNEEEYTEDTEEE